MSVRERIVFLRQLGADFEHTGAVQPSSRWLADAMVAPLRHAQQEPEVNGFRVLEMGCGTGAVTGAIAAVMTQRDQLACYEPNPTFAECVEERVAKEAAFDSVRHRITVFRQPAQEFASSQPVDFVICSVPFNNLQPGIVRALFETGFRALSEGGVFTYFGYLWLPRMKNLVASTVERQRFNRVTAIKRQQRLGRVATTTSIWRNIPPARVRHIIANGSSPAQSKGVSPRSL